MNTTTETNSATTCDVAYWPGHTCSSTDVENVTFPDFGDATVCAEHNDGAWLAEWAVDAFGFLPDWLAELG